MTTRRSFLSRLAGAVIATGLAIECGAKAMRKVYCWEANPEWVDAQYEEKSFKHPNPQMPKDWSGIFSRMEGDGKFFKDNPIPKRYKFNGHGFDEIEPFIHFIKFETS